MNTQIDITENGTTTLATAGKYCDRNIDVNVNIENHYDTFWDAYQYNGTRANYSYAFAGTGWANTNFKPKYPIVIVGGGSTLVFRDSYITCADAPLQIDMSQATSASSTFYQCRIQRIGALDLRNAASLATTFQWSNALKSIEKILLNNDGNQTFTNTFQGCTGLEEIRFEGVIGQNGFSVSNSTNLTHESLISIINALQTKTSGTWTCTLGSTNLRKLTDAEKAIATEKGWTLA